MINKITGKQWLIALLVVCLLAAGAAAALLPQRTQDAAQESDSAVFTFSDSGIAVSASSTEGYEIDGTTLTISGAGSYRLTGTCSAGAVQVKKGTEGVTLILNDLALTGDGTAPIVCGKSSEVTIEAAEGSVNTLRDTAENNDETAPDNENAENAVIKCKDGSRVTLCGSGTLNIEAEGKNGIKSGASTQEEGEASLTIRELTLDITASVNDAVNAESTLTVESGVLTISAGDDALHSDETLTIGAEGTAGPDITITACYEGLEGATLNVCSGNIAITSEDDCLNAANPDLSGYDFSMNISGGSIVAYSTSGDGFDSNGTLTISGGSVVVWTANRADNQPLDADGTITISGGTVLAAGGSSGMGMQLVAEQPCVTFGSGSMFDGFGSDAAGGGTLRARAGNTLTILRADGTELYSGEAVCDANFVFFSSDALTADEDYTIALDSTEALSATAQSGEISSGMGGGPGGFGGKRPENFDGEAPSGMEPPADFNGEPPTDLPEGFEPPADFSGERPDRPDGNGGTPPARSGSDASQQEPVVAAE